MNGQNNDITSDGFRFLGNLHTTSRQLFIVSQFILKVSNKQLPKAVLQDVMIKWSFELERTDANYRNSKGKLTEENRPTSAFNHYLQLCQSLGLINALNGNYNLSRIAHILLALLSDSPKSNSLEIGEKIFYIFQLFRFDADGILLVLGMLNGVEKTQMIIQEKFKEEFNIRLLAKQNSASGSTKMLINEKYRTLNFIWKKPTKYAEHILIPRCEWLSSLGFINIAKAGSSTIYSLSEVGQLFYKQLPFLANTFTKDINEYWMTNYLFNLMHITFPASHRISINDMHEVEANLKLGEALSKAILAVKSSNAFRIPLVDALLYICTKLFLTENIIINFSDIIEKLANGFIYSGKQYMVINTGRLNESYITTRVTQ